MKLKINPQALFNEDGYVTNPTDIVYGTPLPEYYLDLFDQNGYDLTVIEQRLYRANGLFCEQHRNAQHNSLRQVWMTTDPPKPTEGPVLNHCFLFERKGFKGSALKQLREWALECPLYYKVINIMPKWGIDFSMDYVDRTGECFELLHYEHDSFSFEDALRMKELVEYRLSTVDWNKTAEELLSKKDEWMNLEFFEQSAWKCRYFNLPDERFKMVTWQK